MKRDALDPSPVLTVGQLPAHWMPFTGNLQFRTDPRILV